MITLTSKSVYVTPPHHQTTPPAIPFQFVKPLSYEFRVAEHTNADGTIVKIGLQVQVTEHDEFGIGVIKHYWTDVERVKIPYVATVL
jgi:hypothetical protein